MSLQQNGIISRLAGAQEENDVSDDPQVERSLRASQVRDLVGGYDLPGRLRGDDEVAVEEDETAEKEGGRNEHEKGEEKRPVVDEPAGPRRPRVNGVPEMNNRPMKMGFLAGNKQ